MEEYINTKHIHKLQILSIYKKISTHTKDMILEVKPSTRKNKRYVAIFKDGTKTHFGLKGGMTYLDHKDKEKRKNYRKRHKKDLDTNDPYRAGYLSFFLLWSDATNLKDAIKEYNKDFF